MNSGSVRFFDKCATSGEPERTCLGTYPVKLIAKVQGGELTMDSATAIRA